jgi:hypothetical protein
MIISFTEEEIRAMATGQNVRFLTTKYEFVTTIIYLSKQWVRQKEEIDRLKDLNVIYEATIQDVY